jgi:hypothetical protein
MPPRTLPRHAAWLVALLLTAACGGASSSPGAGGSLAPKPASGLPAYDHVLLAIFENHEQSQVVGASNAPYLTALAGQGASFTQSYAVEHPSQPNYLDLFSGANQGVTDDSCPHTFRADNVGHQLIASGRTFVGYSEGLPTAGSAACTSGKYARKHAPWTNFSDLTQTAVGRPFAAFPSDLAKLPSLSWVVPDLCNDMHDCPVSSGDTWAKDNLDGYAQWAKTHNSLLVVTFDEDDSRGGNQIATVLVGAKVQQGTYDERVDHFTVLRTIEDLFDLPALGAAADRSAIADAFVPPGSVAVSSVVPTALDVGRSAVVRVDGPPGSPVSLYARSAPATSSSRVRTGTLDARGQAQFSVAPRTNTHLAAQTSDATSGSVALAVRPAERLRGSSSGTVGSFTGQVVPGHAGGKVRLFTVIAGRVRLVGTTTTAGGGDWSYARAFAASGPVTFISQTLTDAYNLAGQSNRVTVSFS